MHAEVKIEDDILLIERLAVDEFAKVDGWVVSVLVVVRVCTARFGIVLLDGVKMVGGPIGG